MHNHTFIYNGLRISYKKIGSGKPLLFLHGWGVSSNVMLPLAKQLKNTHTCYLIDLPGFGHTPKPPEPWSISDYADLTEQFIEEQIDTLTNLLVHSFGGRITLKLCSRTGAKQIIDKVLITGGAGMKPKRSLTFYVKKYLVKLLKAPFQLLPQPGKERYLSRLRKTKLWEQLGSSDYKKLNGVMRKIFVQSVNEYLEPCLPNIPHDVLLLWGKDDTATPLYQAQRMEKYIEHSALVVIENAGHYSFLDRPKRFTAIARAFFK